MSDQILFDWFDNKLKPFQKIVKFPDSFKKRCKIDENYNNILSDLHINNNNNQNKLQIIKPESINFESKVLRTHRYMIHLNCKQKKILDKYYLECKILYNMCVDIWTKYKEMSTNWQLIKDVIFRYYYRADLKLEYSKIIDQIVDDLKKIRAEYDVENLKYKEEIAKQKAINKEIYIEKLKKWNDMKRESKGKCIIFNEPKPRYEKVKISRTNFLIKKLVYIMLKSNAKNGSEKRKGKLLENPPQMKH